MPTESTLPPNTFHYIVTDKMQSKGIYTVAYYDGTKLLLEVDTITDSDLVYQLLEDIDENYHSYQCVWHSENGDSQYIYW